MITQATIDGLKALAANSSARVAALVADAGPPPPPPPPATGKVPAIGSGMISAAYNRGPADWIDLSKVPLPGVPWSNYSDPVTRKLAPSCNGVRPASTRRIHPLGAYSMLYSKIPMLQNGRHRQWNPEVYSGNDYAFITPRAIADPAPLGPRGTCAVDPYIMFRPHPTIPGPAFPGLLYNPRSPRAIGVDAIGRFIYWLRDESLHLGGTVPGQKDVHDWTPFDPNRRFVFLTNTGNGSITKIDRTAAIAVQVPGQFENSALWVTSVFSTGYLKPTGIECLRDGTMFVCDETANTVWRVAADGSKTAEITNLIAPFALRRTSTDTLRILTLQNIVHHYDPRARLLGPQRMPAQYVRATNDLAGWVNIAVDEFGTMGPVDEFSTLHSTGGSGNVDVWEFRNDNSVLHNNWGGADVTPSGDTVHCGEWVHYGWTMFYAIDEGYRYNTGFANSAPSIIRPRIASDATEEPHDQPLWRRGQILVELGTTRAYQVSSGKTYPRPSLTALMTNNGWGLLGLTCDYMVQEAKAKGWAWLETFYQGGLIGSVPRPEFVGYDLWALFYWTVKNSQQYLSEGAALVNAAKAYILTRYPTAMTPTPTPLFNELSSDTEMHLRGSKLNASTLRVTLEDKWGNPKTMPAGIVVNLAIDEGTSAQRFFVVTAPWQVALPTLSPGPHAVTCYTTTPGYYSVANVIEA